jgi:GMP synthase-like glutamine amidotransferase
MRIHYLQHEPFETPGAILAWAKNRGHALSSTMVYNSEPLPRPGSFDLLVIMGGSMSVYDEPLHPWMGAELRCIESAVGMNKKVLGICLGAQLIARSLGAKVYKNKHKEIGWFPVTLTPEGLKSPLFRGWPEEFTAFQWHGDTFDIPEGAAPVASSEACRNQAFVYEGKTIALQFHPETTEGDLELFLESVSGGLGEGPYIQSVNEIRNGKVRIPAMNELLFGTLEKLTSK